MAKKKSTEAPAGLYALSFDIDELLEIEQALEGAESADGEFAASINRALFKVALVLQRPWALEAAQRLAQLSASDGVTPAPCA